MHVLNCPSHTTQSLGVLTNVKLKSRGLTFRSVGIESPEIDVSLTICTPDRFRSQWDYPDLLKPED